jgi:hypothetical protein
MTVAELIETLREFNSETRVVVNGYEGGYDDISVSEVVTVALNVYHEWYYGKHDVPGAAGKAAEGKKKVDAVILKRI